MNKEFRIDDIFIKKTVRGIPKSEEDLTENIQGYHVFGQNIKYQYSYKVLWDDKYLTRVDSNYPILAYTSSVGEIGIITESFYRTGDNGAFQGLFPRTKIKLMAMLYILVCLQKKFIAFNYSTSMANIVDLTLELPVIKHSDPNHEYTVDDIDWQYMEDRIKELEEDRIKELEEDRIKELEAYLKVTHLDDYELTDEDKKVLSLSRKSAHNEGGALETDCKNGTLRFKKFVASDLFDIKKGKRLTKANMMVGTINFVGSSSTNNGITAKIGNTECIHSANTISVSYNGSVGEVFLQEEPFWASDDVNVWYPKFTFNTRVIEYIMAVIKKCRKKYSYSAKWTLDKMKIEELELPVTPDGDPDFDYMERYIRAIEKLTIADVVKYKDKVIDTTKKLVNSQS